MMQTNPKRPIALFFATSGHSGVDRVVKNLLQEFAAYDLQFDLLSIGGHGPYLDRLPDNVRGIKLAAAHKGTAILPLAAYLLKHRPIALLTAHHTLNRTAILARMLTRSPVRLVIRLGMTLEGNKDKPPSMLRSMRRWYPGVDAIVTPSQGVARDLEKLAGVPSRLLHAIPSPIFNDRLRMLAGQPLDHPWFREGQPPVVLGVGELSGRKDFATLLRAFALVRRVQPCRLVILGEGGSRDALESLVDELGIRDDVQMPGFEANPYRYMARAALFVSSSLREGSPVVVIEAISCGLSVVSTDCPSGPAETLQGGRYGHLVPMGDHEAMAAAMLRTLASPFPAEDLREAAVPFEAKRSARAYLDLLLGQAK